MTRKRYPPREARGLPHEEALKRGICGARRKNEDAPCQGPRDSDGRSACGRHCGAENRVHHPCSQHPRRDRNGRCNNHGAESLVGPESPTWVDGSSSRWGTIFSGDALEHYQAAVGNERYLDLRNDLNILETLFFVELKEAKVGQGGALMRELSDQWKRFQEAQPTKDATTAGRALRRVGELIAEGAQRQAAQEHALRIQESHRRTSETERKRVLDQERTVTQVEAMSFAASYNALLREAIAGESNEEAIIARFNAGAARLVREYVAGGGGGHPAA